MKYQTLPLAAGLMMLATNGHTFSQPPLPLEVAEEPDVFEPTYESVSTRQIPDWFKDSKFGLFFQWGLYTVPAYAPTDGMTAAFREDLPDAFYKTITNIANNSMMPESSYAEWYLSNLKDKNSETYQRHSELYGEGFDYYDFIDAFNDDARDWDPQSWTDVILAAGAEYAVISAKHHDGVSLFPATSTHNTRPVHHQVTERDIVGDFTDSLKAEDLKVGLYYSSYYDWSHREHYYRSGNLFGENGYVDGDLKRLIDGETAVHYDKEAEKLYEDHYAQLIEDYAPEYIWSDIAHIGDPAKVQAMLFNSNKEDAMTNNRWRNPGLTYEILSAAGLAGDGEPVITRQSNSERPKSGGRYKTAEEMAAGQPGYTPAVQQRDLQADTNLLIEFLVPFIEQIKNMLPASIVDAYEAAKAKYDYSNPVANPEKRFEMVATPEYAPNYELPSPGNYFESVRGFGRSFAYNQIETDEDYMDVPEALRTFIDIVSKGGNLLINLAVKSDGSLLEKQVSVVEGLGEYMKEFESVLKGTRPWRTAEITTMQGHDIRITTTREGLINVFLMDGFEKGYKIALPAMNVEPGTRAVLLNTGASVAWENDTTWNNMELTVIASDYEDHVGSSDSILYNVPVIQFKLDKQQWLDFLSSDKSWWEDEETDAHL